MPSLRLLKSKTSRLFTIQRIGALVHKALHPIEVGFNAAKAVVEVSITGGEVRRMAKAARKVQIAHTKIEDARTPAQIHKTKGTNRTLVQSMIPVQRAQRQTTLEKSAGHSE